MKNTIFDEFFRCMAYLGFNCRHTECRGFNVFFQESFFSDPVPKKERETDNRKRKGFIV